MESTKKDLRLAADLSEALRLLRASHDLYQEILNNLRDNVAPDGTADFDPLCQRLNAALTGFAPRDLEIRRLSARFEPGA